MAVTTGPPRTEDPPKLGRPTPMAWLLIVAALAVGFLALRSCAAADPYPAEAEALAADSSELGAAVAGLSERLGDLERVELFRTLKSWARQADAHLGRAEALEPPSDLRVANGFLVGALGLRAEALGRFEPAVRNVLSDRDAQVVASQLRLVMADLVSADRLHALYLDRWPDDREPPPAARWVDPAQASTEGATALVARLRDQPALEAIYNLKVAKLTVTPKPTGKQGDLDVLPAGATLSVQVQVENTGNQRIPAATVDAVLTSETDPSARTAEGRVPALGPGESASVTLSGLRATSGGPVNLLSVTVGLVGGERNALDNKVEYKFVARDGT